MILYFQRCTTSALFCKTVHSEFIGAKAQPSSFEQSMKQVDKPLPHNPQYTLFRVTTGCGFESPAGQLKKTLIVFRIRR